MTDDLRKSFKYKRLTQLLGELPEERQEKFKEMMAEKTSLEKETYGPEEVAKILDVHPTTVRIWLRKGELKGRKIGRKWFVSKSELEKILNPDE